MKWFRCTAVAFSRIVLGLAVPLSTDALFASEPMVHPDPSQVAVHQTTVGTASAIYFCANRHWPASMSELVAFRRLEKVLLEKPLDENWIVGSEITYEVLPIFKLRSRGLYGDHWLVVTFTQRAPRCGQSGVELQDPNIAILTEKLGN